MVESIWDVEFQETFLSALTNNVNMVLSFLQLIPIFLAFFSKSLIAKNALTLRVTLVPLFGYASFRTGGAD